MMLSCKDVTRLISESMDRSLPLGKRVGVRLHLLICKFCVRYERQLLLIRETVRRLVATEETAGGPLRGTPVGGGEGADPESPRKPVIPSERGPIRGTLRTDGSPPTPAGPLKRFPAEASATNRHREEEPCILSGEEGRRMRSRTTRRDFLRMMGAAAGVAVGATLPGILGGRLAISGSFTVPAEAADGSAPASIRVYSAEKGNYVMTQTVVKTKEEWKKALTPEQYHILREKGTERAFTGKYDKNHEHGVYRCAACGLDLYRSEEKYDSGTGWPSFTAPIAASNVLTRPDNSFFSQRTEVLCPRCGGHLGHVFDDGPKPTGKRYCMNSAALQFVATAK